VNIFIVERTIPPAFKVEDAAVVARHARWAVDAYREVGAVWLGGVVTEERMFSVVVCETEDDLRRYQARLGIADADIAIRRVVRPIGPYLAEPAGASSGPFVDTPRAALKSGDALGREESGSDA
jgi:hypothetical protein